MKYFFTNLVDVIPRGSCTLQQDSSADFSVKKETRASLSISDHIKLLKSIQEGERDKFYFFEVNGKVVSNLKPVYSLYMRIEVFFKAIMFFDTLDVFQFIPQSMIDLLEIKIQELIACQEEAGSCRANTSYSTFNNGAKIILHRRHIRNPSSNTCT